MAEILDGWEWVDPDPLEAFLPKAGETPPPAPAAPLIDWKQAVEWRRQGKTEEALDALRVLLADGARNIEPHLAMGHIQFELGRFEEAAAAYFQAVELDPEHRTAYYDLGLSLGRLGRWQEAASAFQQALDFEATNVYARLGLGNCLLHLERLDEALAAFNECVLFDRKRPAGLIGRAVALQLLGRFEEAELAYAELLVQAPDTEEALANLVAMSAAQEDSAKIREYAGRLMRLNPQSAAALKGMATLAFAGNDYAAAAEYCAQLVKVVPDSFEGWFNLREANRELQRAAAARSIA